MHNAPRRRKGFILWRLTKKVVKFSLVMLILAVPTVAIGLPMAVETNWGRVRIERSLSNIAGGPVRMDKAAFSWKTGFTLTNVRADGVRFEGCDSSMTVREIVVTPRVKPVLDGQALFQVVLREPNVLVSNTGAEASPAAWRPGFERACAAIDARVDRLVIEDGTVSYEDPVNLTEPLVASNISLVGDVTRRAYQIEGATVDGIDVGIHELTAKVNGGDVTASGNLVLLPNDVRGRLNLDASDLLITDEVERALERIVPIAPSGEASGRLNVSAALEGSIDELVGSLRLAWDGKIAGSRLMQAAKTASRDLNRIVANVRIDCGRFHHMTELHGDEGMSRFTGSVGFDGAVDGLLAGSRDGEVRIGGSIGNPVPVR